jgi:hypothetical protein
MDAPAIDYHAIATARRKVDPDIRFAHESRLKKAQIKAEVSKLRAANEAIKLELESARLELATRPARSDADMAGLPELAGLWSALVRDDGAKVSERLEASRLLADALGLTKGGARSAGGDAETREVVSAVVLESALAVALAREREATRARMRAGGMGEDAINAILGEE